MAGLLFGTSLGAVAGSALLVGKSGSGSVLLSGSLTVSAMRGIGSVAVTSAVDVLSVSAAGVSICVTAVSSAEVLGISTTLESSCVVAAVSSGTAAASSHVVSACTAVGFPQLGQNFAVSTMELPQYWQNIAFFLSRQMAAKRRANMASSVRV